MSVGSARLARYLVQRSDEVPGHFHTTPRESIIVDDSESFHCPLTRVLVEHEDWIADVIDDYVSALGIDLDHERQYGF